MLPAALAALTAICAQAGIENVNSDFATFISTVVTPCVLGAILAAAGQWQPLASVSGRPYVFLDLSGLATGGTWPCYSRARKLGDAARVAPVDKPGVVLVAVIATTFLGEQLSATNRPGIAAVAGGTILAAYKS